MEVADEFLASLDALFRQEHLCSTCGDDLSRSHPNYKHLVHTCRGTLSVKALRESTKEGCAFCNLVLAVWDNCRKRFDCTLEGDHTFEDELEGLQVRLHSKGQEYILVLDSVQMPNPHSEVLTPWPGKILVYRHDEPPVSSGSESGLAEYKQIRRHSADADCFTIARNWLSDCRENHSLCRPSMASFVPSRLVKIDEPVPRLVSQPPEAVLYAALSHCWGKTQPLKTTRSNYRSLEQGVLFANFPLTFRDAIQTARTLGYSYIWIDSLCIIQDDKEDWVLESSMMASVYNGADIVIAASVADGCGDGFLRERISPRESTVTLETGELYKYRLVMEPRVQETVNPLGKRAWAYQEHVCARRYLGFDAGELVWDWCQRSDGESDWVNTITPRKYGRVCCFGMLVRDEPVDALYKLWHRLVWTYSQLNLSYQEDKLVALSAVASRFQSLLNATYLAGLWKEDLIQGLLWHTIEPSDPQAFCVPSWSWASLVDSKHNTLAGLSLGPFSYEAEVLDASVSLSTSNPLGSVSSGNIKLRALSRLAGLRQGVCLSESTDPSEIRDITFRDAWATSLQINEFGNDFHLVHLDTHLQAVLVEGGAVSARRVDYSQQTCHDDMVTKYLEEEEEGLQVLLIILITMEEESGFQSVGRILGPLGPSSDTFQRIGQFEWDGKPQDANMEAWKTRDVVIL